MKSTSSPRPRPAAKPRLADVAARAGIATMTVSRALRQPETVSPATRERVMEAVAALGYIPNLAASSLASKKSRIVAVVVPTIANSIFAETVQGLSDALTARGFQLLLGESTYSHAAERQILAALIGRQPDAIALVGVVRDEATRRLLEAAHLPIVETWDLTQDPLDLVVGFSNEAAGAAMARYLIGQGRRRLAFVGGVDERATARRRGFEAAAREAGLEPAEIRLEEAISLGAGRRALARLLAGDGAVDAAFFATDVLAVGALLEARRRGIAVPKRLAIAGLGDLEIAGELTPALTTIRIPSYAIGKRAGELILARLAGESVAEPIVDLGFELVARESA
jgi:LacI family transcriptional regulator, gluconate utilization system Gnt-I transcriptional repressor